MRRANNSKDNELPKMQKQPWNACVRMSVTLLCGEVSVCEAESRLEVAR